MNEGSGYETNTFPSREGGNTFPSREGGGTRNEQKTPSFNEVVAAQERCIDKIQMVEHTEYDDEVTCKHSYFKECHQSYVTDYKPTQTEECDESFVKQCFLSTKEHASQEKVQVCHTSLICGGEGKEVCRTVDETRCETRNHVHNVIDDVATCKTVFETDCKDVTSGYTTTEECTKWPKRKCDVKQLDSEKVTPIAECFKVPREVCGAESCALVPGPEECHNETKTIIQRVRKHLSFAKTCNDID